jgi:2-phosphosulfolactate phosphatase
VTPDARRTVDVVLTAGDVVPARLAGRTALVIDVLRASTTIVTALARGAAGVVPVESVEEARARAQALGSDAVLAGERHSDPPPGFDLGNSPLEFTADRVQGRTIVMTTSNGTRALVAARAADAVGVAAFVNAGAAAAWADGRGGDVVIVCAGELGAPSLEDQACAGVVAARLAAAGAVLTAEAAAARVLADAYGNDLARLGRDAPHARTLVAKGRGDDVAFCLTLDSSTVVPVLAPGVDKLVAGAIMQAAVRSGREVEA